MTKLSDKKIRWVINQVVKHGKTPKETANVYDITPHRVRQLVRKYEQARVYPVLQKNRRPKTFLTQEQKDAINQAFLKTKRSPRLLYYQLQRQGTPVPKNKLYEYLKIQGKVIPNPNKQKQRKRCRYERKHSGSLVHTDWHCTSDKHPYCILYEDDASRKILSGKEFSNENAENSVHLARQAVQESGKLNVRIHAINCDHGPQFTSDLFKEFSQEQGIQLVFSRVKNPQTNGKLERLWQEYDKHRWHFSNIQEWINWYNNLLHGALKLEWAETPSEAFQRKMPAESIVGLMFK
ncbi:MAG: transposase integrase [Parcubacteria group bacterium Gr01-1014_48]|nr:MAG: transposase integrase [Parcubacteria group bacterium Gr01-1014_48]